jgi:hypothetical protein
MNSVTDSGAQSVAQSTIRAKWSTSALHGDAGV